MGCRFSCGAVHPLSAKNTDNRAGYCNDRKSIVVKDPFQRSGSETITFAHLAFGNTRILAVLQVLQSCCIFIFDTHF